MLRIDPAWLVDTVSLSAKLGFDDWQRPTYSDPVTVKCRIDRGQIYQGTSNNREIIANAVIFLYPKLAPMPVFNDSWLDGIAHFDGADYTITRVERNSEPASAEVFSYELEVL
jgi:hypothetical protein